MDVTALFQPYPLPSGRGAHAWHYQPEFRRPRHFHEEPEFNLVTRGHGIIEVGDRSIEVSAGSLVWFPPGIEHYLAAASEDFELVTAAFRLNLIGAFKREHSCSPDFARSRQHLEDFEIRGLAELFAHLRGVSDHHTVERRLLEALNALIQREPIQAEPLGYRAASFLLTHPTTSRDHLARVLRSNRGDVSRHFHRDHGTTLVQYRNTLRALEFLRLSEQGQNNLTRAAIEAGFGSYSQCHRVFRSLFGVSPREYSLARSIYRAERMQRFEPLYPSRTPASRASHNLP